MGQSIDMLASCDGNCHQQGQQSPLAKSSRGSAPRTGWDEDALVSCSAMEDSVQHAVANANRGGARVSDSVLLNHELLQHARQGNVKGLSDALERGAWTETRRPLVMKPQKPEAGAKGGRKSEQADIGMTALMFASQTGSPECVRQLLKSNAEINALEEDGWSSLHFAAKEGHVETCKVLLQARANPALMTCDEKSPMQVAIEEEDNGDFVDQLMKLIESQRSN